uniref:Uncharacterized protein n=1 Tax=Anguilla anguilla TaxID=7936 RepID=A0A0E9UHB8_ANGAN
MHDLFHLLQQYNIWYCSMTKQSCLYILFDHPCNTRANIN